MKNHTMYNLVQDTIEGMKIGQKKTIELPDNLPFFRKYLSEISRKIAHRYTTKTIDGKLQIMRVKYFNIFSKEVE